MARSNRCTLRINRRVLAFRGGNLRFSFHWWLATARIWEAAPYNCLISFDCCIWLKAWPILSSQRKLSLSHLENNSLLPKAKGAQRTTRFSGLGTYQQPRGMWGTLGETDSTSRNWLLLYLLPEYHKAIAINPRSPTSFWLVSNKKQHCHYTRESLWRKSKGKSSKQDHLVSKVHWSRRLWFGRAGRRKELKTCFPLCVSC
jgi:hypothetical protein